MTGAQFTYRRHDHRHLHPGHLDKGQHRLRVQSTRHAADPLRPVPLRTFTAEFQTYPGANTNTINLLLNYKNPAYTDNNWPAWTTAQSQAYQTLTTIASAGANGPNARGS